MVHRSRVASASDMRALRKAGGRSPRRSARLALKNAAAFALLGGVVYALPAFVGHDSLREKGLHALSSLGGAGAWVRSTLVSAFQSIPLL